MGLFKPKESPLEQVESDAAQLYERTLTPIAARFGFERPPAATETKRPPTVLLLGNHSSGKSSFINFLLGQEFQRTGVAPIDDGFTIITFGDKANDREGEAIVGDPSLPWKGLKSFGLQLVNHLRLRHCPDPKLEGITLVDSPGMIDSPDGTDRGYDFRSVVRWFALRSDVIMLMFDGDKPGTTGETLNALTASLHGLEDRLVIVFNKADRFAESRDYARAYGALCWNLAKVLDRVDLPHIYTMFLPVPGATPESSALPKEDFERQRIEVCDRILGAPARRADNVISHLYHYARRLRMHSHVMHTIARDRRTIVGKNLGVIVGVAIIAALAATLHYGWFGLRSVDLLGGAAFQGILLGALAVALGTAGHWWLSWRKHRQTPLTVFFERTYGDELKRGDEVGDLKSLWQLVESGIARVVAETKKLPILRPWNRKNLDKIVDETVPKLRQQVRTQN